MSGAAYPKLPEPPDFAEYLKMQALCEKNGARLIVINTQEHIVRKLGQANYYGSTQYAADFFREHQIPFYDFDYIRPERMPDLSNTMFDFCHMKDEGATIFSQTLATLLEEIKSGKDVGNWFMTRDEYLKTVDFIPNVWICDISEKKDDEAVYEADCNRGSQVVPEYRFVLVAEDGAETTVQDWSENPLYITQKGTLNGQILRVYARSQGTAENAQTVSYDFK